jgi:hypothetical protein
VEEYEGTGPGSSYAAAPVEVGFFEAVSLPSLAGSGWKRATVIRDSYLHRRSIEWPPRFLPGPRKDVCGIPRRIRSGAYVVKGQFY